MGNTILNYLGLILSPNPERTRSGEAKLSAKGRAILFALPERCNDEKQAGPSGRQPPDKGVLSRGYYEGCYTGETWNRNDLRPFEAKLSAALRRLIFSILSRLSACKGTAHLLSVQRCPLFVGMDPSFRVVNPNRTPLSEHINPEHRKRQSAHRSQSQALYIDLSFDPSLEDHEGKWPNEPIQNPKPLTPKPLTNPKP